MDLDKVLRTIFSQFTSPDGRLVNYEKLKSVSPWKAFLKASKVHVADNGILKKSENERKCFFINLYNFLCIYGVCNEPVLPQEVTKVTNFFGQDLCLLGDVALSLDDILHGILRCNRPHPGSHTPFFKDKSPKLQFSLNTLDLRVLFVVNTADLSSPPLRVFSASNLDSDLSEAVSRFLTPRVACNSAGRSIVIPRIFLWFHKDFPGGHDVGCVRWIASYLPRLEAVEVSSLMDDLERVGGVRIVHDCYNWSLNDLSESSRL